MQVKKILNKDDLMEIAEFFIEKGYGDNISVEIELPDQKTINRVNEDFFYRLNPEEEINKEPEELFVNIGGIKFRYFVKEK